MTPSYAAGMLNWFKQNFSKYRKKIDKISEVNMNTLGQNHESINSHYIYLYDGKGNRCYVIYIL